MSHCGVGVPYAHDHRLHHRVCQLHLLPGTQVHRIAAPLSCLAGIVYWVLLRKAALSEVMVISSTAEHKDIRLAMTWPSCALP